MIARAILAGHVPGHNPDPLRPGQCEYDYNVAMVDCITRGRSQLMPIVSHGNNNDASIIERIHAVQTAGMAVSIEVHHNALANPTDCQDYALVLYRKMDEHGWSLANRIKRNCEPWLVMHGIRRMIIGAACSGSSWGYYEAVCLPTHTALILECCFFTNPAHSPLIEQPLLRQAYADLIGDAIEGYHV